MERSSMITARKLLGEYLAVSQTSDDSHGWRASPSFLHFI